MRWSQHLKPMRAFWSSIRITAQAFGPAPRWRGTGCCGLQRVQTSFLPSLEDCVLLLGPVTAEDAGQTLRAAGAREVIVTDGPGPVTLCTEDGQSVIAFQQGAAPVDTTGAGDAFNAGYLSARLNGQTPQQAVAEGQRLSQLAIATRGALLP